MASMKAEKPVGSQLPGQTKKEHAKTGECCEPKPAGSQLSGQTKKEHAKPGECLFGQTKKEPAKSGESGGPKPPSSKQAELKPQEPKKKPQGGKPGAKN